MKRNRHTSRTVQKEELMKKAALLLCTLLLAALAGCQLGGKAIILPKAGNITAIQVETLEGESLSLTQEEDIARLLEVLNTGWSIGRESVQDQPLVEPRHFPPGRQPGKRPAPARLSMGNQKKAQP